MRTNETAIVHEADKFWVCRENNQFTVYRSTLTHSVADSSYPATDDGLSLAIARCDYLEKRRTK